jgi:hypothetical protein
MLKQLLFSAAFLTLLLAGRAEACIDAPGMTTNGPPAGQSAVSGDEAVGAALKSASAWISAVFNLPEPRSLPAVRRVSGKCSAHEMFARYDDDASTIDLADNWTGATPAEMSALVRATARHFQKAGGRVFDCPEERNEMPYDAQARWLALYDRSLKVEFRTDQATLMLLTQCVP